MSNLKISEDLFLEKQELNRFKRFIFDDGFKQNLLMNTQTFGIVSGSRTNDGVQIQPQDSFSVKNVGSGSGLLTINPGRAINKFAEILTLDTAFNLQVPNTGQWYWVKIKYKITNEEVGTCGIDASGNLSGTSTFFEEVLRGQPNFPAKIKFTNSTLGNTQEYEVLDVLSQTSATLNGIFATESNLKYAVVGTFTPGYIAPLADKLIFDYDSVEISLVLESALNTEPVKLTDEEFYLARVQVSGLNVIVEDKRNELFQLKADFYVRDLFNPITSTSPNSSNKIAGVSAIKFDHFTSSRDCNIIYFDWGFLCNNWILDTTNNIITVQSGSGGRFKDTSSFLNGDFDGWRIYSQNGKYSRIISSFTSGTNINLVLDYLDPINFPINKNLSIVPNAEEIEVFLYTQSVELTETKFTYPINNGPESNLYPGAKIKANVYNGNTTKYGIRYRYKTLNSYSEYFTLLDDTLGYYNENQFDNNGDLLVVPVPTRTSYLPSASDYFLTLIEASSSYINTITSLVTGDRFGVDHKTLADATPQLTLTVGTDRQYQMFDDTGSTLNLSSGHSFVILSSINNFSLPCKNGNSFILHFKQRINPSTFKLRIVYNFLNVTTWTPLKEFTSKDFDFIQQSEEGLRFRCTFDGTSWLIDNVNESKFNIKTNFFFASTVGTNVTATGSSWQDIPGAVYTTPNDGISRRYEIIAKTTNEIAGTGFGPEIGAGMRIVNVTTNTQLDFSRWYINEFTTGQYYNLFQTISVLFQGVFAPGTQIKIQGRIEGNVINNMDFTNNKLSIKEL